MFPRMTFLCRSRLAWIHRSFCVRFRWKHSSRHPACYAWEYKTLATHSCSLLPAGSPGWPSAASGPMEAAVPLLHFSFPRFWVWCVINSMMKSSSLWCPSSKSCKRWQGCHSAVVGSSSMSKVSVVLATLHTHTTLNLFFLASYPADFRFQH